MEEGVDGESTTRQPGSRASHLSTGEPDFPEVPFLPTSVRPERSSSAVAQLR